MKVFFLFSCFDLTRARFAGIVHTMNNYNDTKRGASLAKFGVPNNGDNMYTLMTLDGRAMINGLGQVKIFSTEQDARDFILNTQFSDLRPILIQLVTREDIDHA
jgi:hypothetical protein